MKSIGAVLYPKIEVGIATSDGKAYYRITSLLKKIKLPYVDIIPDSLSRLETKGYSFDMQSYLSRTIKILITTRKERSLLLGANSVCVEDLGDDMAVAKERLFSLLYPLKATDLFVIGIDPGERTGLAAFMNHKEVETAVLPSFEKTIARVSDLIDNAPSMRKVVKIGAGNLRLAQKMAAALGQRYRERLTIQLVDERGTSTLSARRRMKGITRDQRAARLIAFRDGQEFVK
ncbi:MAG: hypothetical protein M1587_06140 [Thaumarchaeota archaeon]|nr:hypothetical protein [Nitrososphaerota archaeon]MCL5067750.1 hypothetical protein [Nitrososphaerota archaeon]